MDGLMWWIDRWRKSTAYTDMTVEEQGAFRNLLDEAALRDGALPADERMLAKACGDALIWDRVRVTVLARFSLVRGVLRNDTLDKVIRESKRRRRKQKDYRNRKRGQTAGHDDGNATGNAPRNDGGHDTGNKPAYLDLRPGSEDQEQTPAPLPRRVTPVHELPEPTWKTALAIALSVIDDNPTSSAAWVPEFKGRCLQQGWNYSARHAAHEPPIMDRALAAAEAMRRARQLKANLNEAAGAGQRRRRRGGRS